MKQHDIPITYKARYFTLGELNRKTQHLIFVLHGQGQLAQYFITKFKGLDTGSICIIAPEGLSRYYLEGFTGRVGATWMTREDRLRDIDNYITYLNSVFDQIIAQAEFDEVPKVTCLGFSQGAATASRWVASLSHRIDQLVLWAGIFPPDLNYELARDRFDGIDIKYVYGNEDPFLDDKRMKEMYDISRHLQVKPETITFNGKHVIDEPTLLKVFKG